MTKIYINKKEVKKIDKYTNLKIAILELLVSAVTLMLASSIFENFYVENIFYALLASLLISVLNVFLKPTLVFLTLPLTLMSFGLLYPLVNLFILKITGLLLGSSFIVKGWILPFFISIFISYVTSVLEKLIVDPYKGGN